jgi:hypothetical protein
MAQIEMAHTCSNCSYSMFKKPGYDWYASGKKQLGICFALCDGLPPRCEEDVSYRNKIELKVEYTEYYDEKYVNHRNVTMYTISNAARVGIVLEKEYYLELRRQQITKELSTLTVSRYRDILFYGLDKYIDEALADSVKFYDKWRANYDWWQINFAKARRCHRNLVCDLWNHNGKRETVAKSILSGHYALDGSKYRFENARIVET